MRTIRRCRPGRRGFSLLEAMIASGLLGIGLVGLAKLHISSIQGTARSEEMNRGAEVARQLADTFATLDWANLPSCPPGPTGAPPPAPAGCSSVDGPTNVLTAEKGPGCTAWYTFDGVPDVSNTGWASDPMAGDGSAADSGNFRVDLAVSHHPDPTNFPISGATNPEEDPVQVLWIWVCWRDENGGVHEVSSARVMTENL